MRIVSTLAGRAGRALWSVATSRDEDRLRRRFRVREGWREAVDGRAPRLGAGETIAPYGPRRGRPADPLAPADGWRDPWRALVLTGWAGAIGVAWLLGRRGRGPLSGLR